MDELDDFWVHTITVQPRAGAGANGKVRTDPVEVSCFIDGGTKTVRTTNGELIVAAAPVYAPVSAASVLPIGAAVTLPGETTPRQIVAVTVRTSGGLGLPDHIELALT
jgi:hypothetical protein